MSPAIRKMQGCARSLGWTFAALLITSPTAWADVTVSLNAPANGTSYVPPVNITLSASASASGGYTVSKVEFFYGTTLIGTDTSSPYSITWNNAPSGQHVLTAKATAIKNNSPDQTATSSAANITVNAPPVVSFTAPPDYLTVNMPPPPIAVSASASDSDGTISKVEFWETQCSLTSTPGLLATVTTPPYGFTWNISPPYHAMGKPQIRCIQAIVTDNLGGQSTDLRGVILEPTIALSSPINGATYTGPASIPLAVAVTPSDWPIERVQFYNGTTLIGETFTAPYSFTWGNVTVGSYSLTAKMISNTYGYESTSAPVNITVNAAVAQLHFIHADHLNTPRLVANQSGQTVWRWDQAEPFGNNPADENPSGLGVFDLPLRLPGQYFDKETNLHYNYFRDYDPGIGRYVQSDLIGLYGGLNTYAYAGGDPIYLRDPSGLILECKEVFAGYTTRTERIKVKGEVSGWVLQCRPVAVGGQPGIPDPFDRSQRDGPSGGFPGDVQWQMVCRNEWKVIQPAVWEIRTTILERYYTKCEDKDACPPKSYILGGRYVPLDPAAIP